MKLVAKPCRPGAGKSNRILVFEVNVRGGCEMIKWIKNNKVLFFVILVFSFGILFVVIPIIINAMYIDNKGYMTVWGGKDLLTFYGSILSFLGAFFLGGLALWQNERLSEINKNLIEHQYKPILTISVGYVNDPKEVQSTFFRTIKQNRDAVMINVGYSSKPNHLPHTIIGIKNIGLGPAINIATSIHNLTSVDGVKSLDEIAVTNIENFYDKMHFDNYKYYENEKILNGNWQIYTDFDLGISDENNKLNLAFSFENIKEPLHSIIEFSYENILGHRYKQFMYMSYITKPSFLPISKIY